MRRAGFDEAFARVAGVFYRAEQAAVSAGVSDGGTGPDGAQEFLTAGRGGGAGRALVYRELYLPESWIGDRDRYTEAGFRKPLQPGSFD